MRNEEVTWGCKNVTVPKKYFFFYLRIIFWNEEGNIKEHKYFLNDCLEGVINPAL